LTRFAWQVAKGMAHLNTMKCVHRDLAARNVLISSNLIAKISDFGLSRAVYESGYYFKQTKGRLPLKWMAPEAIIEGLCTSQTDVWSFGILIWELITLGGSPYPGVPIASLVELLKSGYRMPRPDHCSQQMYEMMQMCWQEKPQKRPTFGELVNMLDRDLQTLYNKEYLELQPDNVDLTSTSGEPRRSCDSAKTLQPGDISPTYQNSERFDNDRRYQNSRHSDVTSCLLVDQTADDDSNPREVVLNNGHNQYVEHDPDRNDVFSQHSPYQKVELRESDDFSAVLVSSRRTSQSLGFNNPTYDQSFVL